MRRADYRCKECGATIESIFDYTPPDCIPFVHVPAKGSIAPCTGTGWKVWGSVHTGRGSSGEPPR